MEYLLQDIYKLPLEEKLMIIEKVLLEMKKDANTESYICKLMDYINKKS